MGYWYLGNIFILDFEVEEFCAQNILILQKHNKISFPAHLPWWGIQENTWATGNVP